VTDERDKFKQLFKAQQSIFSHPKVAIERSKAERPPANGKADDVNRVIIDSK
jgi:hypothetical protein